MPRPKKNAAANPSLSPGQAAYVLDRLIRDRRVTQYDVQRYVNEIGKEIQDLQRRLAELQQAGGGNSNAAPATRRPGRPPGRPAAAVAAPAAPAAVPAKRRRRITSQQLASRQLQGRYLALVRQIPASRRSMYAKIAKEKGREAAIKEMQNAISK